MSSTEDESRSKPVQSRVLIVDDDPAILLTTEALLEERFTVVTAQSGEEAMAILASREFDAVCTDYSMGKGMNGLELLRKIAAMPTIIGRVLLTGQPEIGESASLCYVLLKPYEASRLIEVIERAASQAISRRRIAVSVADARKALGSGAGPRTDATTPPKRRT